MAEDVGSVDAEVVQQPDDITGQRRRCDRSVDVSGAAVTLQLDADDLMLASQDRDQLGEVELDGQHAAVQQDQRRAAAVDLVVHVDPVDVGVPALLRPEGAVRRLHLRHEDFLLTWTPTAVTAHWLDLLLSVNGSSDRKGHEAANSS
jgi:hypothetical protein